MEKEIMSEPRKRGRKPGTKNRPKDVIAAERALKALQPPKHRGRKPKAVTNN
jgi:hypothetical protein